MCSCRSCFYLHLKKYVKPSSDDCNNVKLELFNNNILINYFDKNVLTNLKKAQLKTTKDHMLSLP